jgi:hydroxyacylglutathione hydrolase
MALIVKRLVVGPLQTNCYLVGCEETKEGAIIDPGGDPQAILVEAEKAKLAIKYIINTHCHFDHTLANGDLMKATGAPLVIHRAEKPLLEAGGGASLFGLQMQNSPSAKVLVDEGDVITVGRVELKVLHTPGHSPGGISLYNEAEGIFFSGDTLFNMGIGRTDLPGGDFHALMESIKTKIFTLPDETVVYSGHGPQTTVGQEKRDNPFILY